MIRRAPKSAFLSFVVIALIAATGCFGDDDEAAEPTEELGADVGYDADQELPSVESIDFESAAPSTPPRIHVESSAKSGVIADDPPLRADSYFSDEQASKILGNTDVEAQPVAGQGSSPQHNSIRYAPVGADGDLFGVGLQIWDLSDADIAPAERLAELREQFLNVQDLDDAPDGSFGSRRSSIRNFVFTSEDDPYLFILSCDVDHCTDWDDLIELGSDLATR